jgi:hypothetical protein
MCVRILLASFLAAAQVPAADIVSAQIDQPAGPVRFDAEAGAVDWKALAQQKFGSEALEHPPAAKLQQLWDARDLFDTTDESFTSPSPAPLSRKHYYLISTRGIVPLEVSGLKGEIVYQFA